MFVLWALCFNVSRSQFKNSCFLMLHKTVEQTSFRIGNVFVWTSCLKILVLFYTWEWTFNPKRTKLTYKSGSGSASDVNFIRSFVNRVKPLKPWRSLFFWVFALLLLGWVFFLKISDSFFKPFIWIAFCCFQGCSNLPKLAACNRPVS